MRWLDEVIKRNLTPLTVIRLVPITVVLLSGIILTGWASALLGQQRDLVVHTHEAIETAKDVLIALDDAETGQRGYLLSGEPRYLEPYARGRERIGTMSAELARLVSDNADQAGRVATLSVQTGRKLDELEAAIAARQTHGPAAAATMMLSGTDRAIMDEVRAQIGRITEAEKQLLRERDAEVQAAERQARIIAILVGLASIVTRVAVEAYVTRTGLEAAATPKPS